MGIAKALTAGEAAEEDLQSKIEKLLRARAYRDAMSLLMNHCGDDIYRYAVGMTRDADLAEEVRQQVFAQAHRDLERSASPRMVVKWLFGIARFRSYDAVCARAQWRQRYKNDAPEEAEPLYGDPSVELDRKQMAKVLAGCLSKLGAPAREAVLLRYQQDLSYEEAADLSGESATTLRQRVARAMPRLRKCVEGATGEGGGQ